MHADLVADLPISAWRHAVGCPPDKERPCRLSPPEMVNRQRSSTSVCRKTYTLKLPVSEALPTKPLDAAPVRAVALNWVPCVVSAPPRRRDKATPAVVQRGAAPELYASRLAAFAGWRTFTPAAMNTSSLDEGLPASDARTSTRSHSLNTALCSSISRSASSNISVRLS